MKWSGNKLSYMVEIGGIEKGLETWIPFVRYREHLFDTSYIREITERKQSEEYKNRIYSLTGLIPRCLHRSEKRKPGSDTPYACIGVVHFYEYEDESGSIKYEDKGYVCGTREIREEEMKFGRNICFEEGECIAQSSKKYLRKIIEYCQKQEIGITLITSPIFDLQLLSTENYDNYVECVSNIAEDYGIAYYDFNLVKPKFLDIQKKRVFCKC